MNIKLGVALAVGVVFVSALSGCAPTGIEAPEPVNVPDTTTNLLEDAILLGTIERKNIYEFHVTDQNGVDATCILSVATSYNAHSISCYPSAVPPQ